MLQKGNGNPDDQDKGDDDDDDAADDLDEDPDKENHMDTDGASHKTPKNKTESSDGSQQGDSKLKAKTVPCITASHQDSLQASQLRDGMTHYVGILL